MSADPSEWENILRTNVLGAALTMRHAAEQMLRQPDGGHLVITSSTVGRAVYEQHPMYTASKFAVGALAAAVRRELLGRIRVTLVEPGEVKTEFTDVVADIHLSAEQVAQIVVWCIQQPADVALHEVLLTHARERV
jgi:NADP-dependent 3-hydroxy acid dehydrogenase YdfG